ncbi:MAG TPA: DinB family protein [Actinomycetota bacterium]|nr:DinB family protein [Actinomycetota bacterium]
MPVTDAEVRRIMAHFDTSVAGGRCTWCSFDWTIGVEEAATIVGETPEWCRQAFEGRWEEARRKPAPELWSPSAYVWHMADAIGVWAERLVALAQDRERPLAGFDQDDLADVRRYEELSTRAGLWAFQRRVDDWNDARAAISPDTELLHPDFGPWTVAAVVRWMAHDLNHHRADITRALAA